MLRLAPPHSSLLSNYRKRVVARPHREGAEGVGFLPPRGEPPRCYWSAKRTLMIAGFPSKEIARADSNSIQSRSPTDQGWRRPATRLSSAKPGEEGFDLALTAVLVPALTPRSFTHREEIDVSRRIPGLSQSELDQMETLRLVQRER